MLKNLDLLELYNGGYFLQGTVVMWYGSNFGYNPYYGQEDAGAYHTYRWVVGTPWTCHVSHLQNITKIV